MEEIIVSNRYAVPCPPGFRKLTKKELKELSMMGEGDSECLKNEEQHIMVSIGWKQINAFSGFLLKLFRPVRSVEASINRAMAPYGYRKETDLTRKIGGSRAEGFRFIYTAGGVPMIGESYVIREGKNLVFFHGYMQAGLRDESLPVWNSLLDSVRAI